MKKYDLLINITNDVTNALLIVTLASRTPQEKPFNRDNENGTYATSAAFAKS